MSDLNIIHTMIRVSDLNKSINFYQNVLGMQLNSKKDYPDGKFTLAFLGYGSIKTHPQIELTYNWDTNQYTMGNAFGHIALRTSKIYELCEEVKQKGGVVSREPGPMKFGTTVIAFIEDPDGYKIELIQEENSQKNS